MHKALVLISFLSVGSISAQLSPVIKTKLGLIQGKLVQLRDAKQDVYEFTGVPFAEPPVGDFRFKKPTPKNSWANIIDATKATKSCVQVVTALIGAIEEVANFAKAMVAPGTEVSEDCLYLNIWVPRSTLDSVSSGKQTKQLSVYVFIPGGGFIFGNSMMKLYNGTMISGFNNIIFVSIQYRLGSLGFAYFGKNDDAVGNVGLWDQLEALKWVNENIASFGGNRNEVTIGGESAGAASVTLHLLSPESRKYFQKAIVESGTATARWAAHDPDQVLATTETVLRAVCGGSVNNESTIAEKLKCLRSADASDIANADAAAMLMGIGPVIDGDFIPRNPAEMLATGDFYKVPLLIGANKDEASVFLLAIPDAFMLLPSFFNRDASLDKLNYTHYLQLMDIGLQILSPNYTVDPVVFNAVQLHYWPTSHDGYPTGADVVDAIIQAAGDFALTCPTYNFAKMAAPYLKVGNQSIFVYRYSQPLPFGFVPKWMGAFHASEMMLVFGEPFAEYAKGLGYTDEHKRLSQVMMEYWGNFVKYGDPNVRDEIPRCGVNPLPGGGKANCCSRLRNWPPYTGKDCNQQLVDLCVAKQVYQIGEATTCGYKARDCLFWAEHFPTLLKLAGKRNT